MRGPQVERISQMGKHSRVMATVSDASHWHYCVVRINQHNPPQCVSCCSRTVVRELTMMSFTDYMARSHPVPWTPHPSLFRYGDYMSWPRRFWFDLNISVIPPLKPQPAVSLHGCVTADGRILNEWTEVRGTRILNSIFAGQSSYTGEFLCNKIKKKGRYFEKKRERTYFGF